MSISPDHSIGETTMFPEAFGQTLDCHPHLDGILGDGIYGCRWITNLVSGNHATPHLLPRSNVTFKSIGRRGGMICFIRWEDPQGWLEEYPICSISETVNSMVKCRFGAHAWGRDLNRGRRLRRGSKFVGHNIRRVGYLEVMGGVVPHWREGCA